MYWSIHQCAPLQAQNFSIFSLNLCLSCFRVCVPFFQIANRKTDSFPKKYSKYSPKHHFQQFVKNSFAMNTIPNLDELRIRRNIVFFGAFCPTQQCERVVFPIAKNTVKPEPRWSLSKRDCNLYRIQIVSHRRRESGQIWVEKSIARELPVKSCAKF